MGNSFGDQFLKAGLVDKSRLEKAKKSKRRQQKLKQKQKVEVVDETAVAAEAARKAAAEAAERDRELNRQRKAAAERRATQAQVRQLVEQNRLTDAEGDVVYNFQDGTLVKRLHVTETVRDRLAHGQLAIVRFDAGYALVPAGVAEKIGQRDAACLVSPAGNRPQEDADDPYAAYQVPDDLMW
ncbi:MAG: nucleoprotein/polynucleotide-associated enzyme [Gammaproteobacteria bacterium]|nr:nucleoprotein/polynucleotide-associated enzyme [Gammaproteobacteria bacterium]